jgi:response regulator RpfG family c-di-GMP phosphodiesterase
MTVHENRLVQEIETLQEEFSKTTNKLIKDVKRQDKIMARSDKRQQQEYDELQRKFAEVEALQREIEDTQKEVVFTMGAIGESRSKETGNHVKRVAEYSKILALHYGLDERESEMLKQASPMHDIGKVAIPDAVLNKPGRFDEHERKIMDTHAELGYDMLNVSDRPLLKMAAIVAYEHHEKWNGTGYPNQTKGEEIHIYGRITALADVFDALGSSRVYKKAWSDEKIFKMFKEERGEHFDPKLIDIFFDNLDEFLAVRDSLMDTTE